MGRVSRIHASGWFAWLVLGLACAAPRAWADALRDVDVQALSRLAPSADAEVLALALQARACALADPGLRVSPDRLAVIDYTRPSLEQRLWVFSLAGPTLLALEWVAHGRGSGANLARAFSNRPGTAMSSVGAFVARETYHGANGFSLRLDGLEPGFNDRARERAIVMHGADYVNPALARAQGRLGRSLGCPALRPAAARQVVEWLQDGGFVFAYGAVPEWLDRSWLLRPGCGMQP